MPTKFMWSGPSLARARAPFSSVAAILLACTFGTLHGHAQEGYAADMKAGRAAYNQNDMATAQRHFDAAMKGAENDRQKGSAVYALGVIAQKQNNLPEAKQRAEQALAINPQDKQAKGLLDEVNAAPANAKKPAAKGLAKTPLAPGTRQRRPSHRRAKGERASDPAGGQGPASRRQAHRRRRGSTQVDGRRSSRKRLDGVATNAPGGTPPLPKAAKPTPKPVATKPGAAPGPAPVDQAKATTAPAAAKKAPAVKAGPSGDPDVTSPSPPATGSLPRKSSEVIQAPPMSEPTANGPASGGVTAAEARPAQAMAATTPAIMPTGDGQASIGRRPKFGT